MKSTYLKTGDVVRTNPFKDFWIASVVLATQEKTEHTRQASLIGETNAVFRHAFAFEDIDRADWRVARGVSGFEAGMPVVKTYYSLVKPGVDVIGHVDPLEIESKPYVLKFGPGDPPHWPIQGPLSHSIGMSGLHAWRKAHDIESWSRDLEEARLSHLALMERLKAETREKRKRANRVPETD